MLQREGKYRTESPGALSTVFLFTLKEHLALIEVQFGLTYNEDSLHQGYMLFLVDKGECQKGEV